MSQPWDAIGNAPRNPFTIAIFLLAVASLITASLGRRPWQNVLGLTAALGLAAYTGGPLILAGSVALAAAGRKMQRA